jgi:uncharacterized protein with ATP-grasp and redox domains
MKTFVDCVPCIMTQAVRAPRRFTDDPQVVVAIAREVAAALSRFDFDRPPPEMGGVLNGIMARHLGLADPYLEEKRRFNAMALALLPGLRERIARSPDPFEAAVRLAVAGNAMDFGAPGGRTDGDLAGMFESSWTATIAGGGVSSIARLKAAVARARSILYLADNAGEIAIDRLLIERLPAGSVTVAVRSGPAINDALRADAEQVGLPEVATVIESGVALPGTPLGLCSDELQGHFRAADVVISKGQGNFETLSEAPRPLWFLLMIKCEVVARHAGCAVGDLAVIEGPTAG